MKIAIIGATGKAGHLIMKEALLRGHEVTAFARSVSKVQETNVHVVEKNLFELTADDLKPYDVVVNAFNSAGEYTAGKDPLIENPKHINQRFTVVSK